MWKGDGPKDAFSKHFYRTFYRTERIPMSYIKIRESNEITGWEEVGWLTIRLCELLAVSLPMVPIKIMDGVA